MDILEIADEISSYFSVFEQVEAVAMGGSQTGSTNDEISDIDLYVFIAAPIPPEEREKIVQKRGATRCNLNLQFWDPGDEWYDAPSGIEIDVMYWDVRWIRNMLDNVLVRQQASMGYTTCFWRTIYHAIPLFDRNGWFHDLQESVKVPYPEGLRQAIIEKNFPVLRQVIPSYLSQIEKAFKRNDPVSVNHRLAAFLASYFDVLFAYNRVLHPGEKRLLTYAKANCPNLPRNMEQLITSALQAAADGRALPGLLNQLVDNLETMLCKAEII